MNDWSNFFAAMAESAATLTGLIFVGVSINLARILSTKALPDRALESLILLLNILIISAHSLVPHRTIGFIGYEILFTASITWGILIYLDTRILRNTEKSQKRYAIQNAIFSQLATLPYILGGIMILCQGFDGIYYIIPGIIISFIKAIIDAWVLLVEIHR